MLQLNVRPEILTHNHCGKSCLGQWQRLNGPYHRGRWCMYIALQVLVVLQQLLLPTSTGFMAWMWVSDFTPLTCYLQNVPLLLSLLCSLYVTDSVTPLCVIYLWDPDGSNVAIKVPNACACFLRAGCLYHSFNVRKFEITCSISEWFIGLQWKKSTWKVFFALQGMWTACLIIYSNCSAIPDGDCI